MIIFPAIDILDGKAVRLTKGDYNSAKVYGTPTDMARQWESLGAEYIHIVDLNGARGEKTENINLIEKITENINCKLQVGGGIRTMSDITLYLERGIDRIILGSVCVENKELVRAAVNKYGSERIACGIDAKNERVAINGWQKSSDVSLKELCLEMKGLGVSTLICTDIARDGVLSGVNVKQIKELIELTNMNIIASGGVNSLDDIVKLKDCGAHGVILGKALYENRIALSDAIMVARE